MLGIDQAGWSRVAIMRRVLPVRWVQDYQYAQRVHDASRRDLDLELHCTSTSSGVLRQSPFRRVTGRYGVVTVTRVTALLIVRSAEDDRGPV